MSEEWKLKRTAQCKGCPWIKGVDPHQIPGYCPTKHEGLISTIAQGDALQQVQSSSQVSMACHETHDSHCIGWLMNQLGSGNNVLLRLAVGNCTNIDKVRLRGEQHATFADTIPKESPQTAVNPADNDSATQ